MPVLNLICLVWALVLSGAWANAPAAPAAPPSRVAAVVGVFRGSIGYDAPNQANADYDDRSKRICCYDEASMLVGDEKEKRSAMEFAHLVKSVAAEGAR